MKKKLFRRLIGFIIFQIVFAMITFPILVFYGPFEIVKKSVVGMLVHSTTKGYIAEFFLSDDRIYTLMNENKPIDIDELDIAQDLDKVIVEKENSTNVDVHIIDGGIFKGKMIVVDNPQRVKVGYTSKLTKVGETTSKIAKRYNAVAAINAGGFLGYNFGSSGGTPMGFVISGGKVVYNIEDENKPVGTVAFNNKGQLIVGNYSLNQLKKLNVKEGVSFDPPLIVNGEPTIEKGDGGRGIAPRTAIGQKKDGTVLLMVIDGRSLKSIGATLRDVQEIFLKYGAYNAVNLDGGSSSTLYYKGKIINNPSDALGERSIPTVFYVESSSIFVEK